jgi:menaquinone-9 beta-reductase
MNLGSNISTDDAIGRFWDVVVVGAGPAGVMAARELARGGCDVLLVEARSFPRAKVCGGCVNEHTAALLEKAGLESVIPRSSAVPLHEFRIHYRGWTPRYRLPGGWSVTRATFDSLLLEAALAAGVNYLDETRARLESDLGEGFRKVQITQSGTVARLRARLVICADGLSRSATRTSTGDIYTARDAFIGAGVVVDAPSLPPALAEACPAGSVTMAVGNGGYVGISEAEGGKYSLAAAMRPSLVKEHGAVGGAVEQLLVDAGLPADGAVAGLEWQGTPLLRSGLSAPSGPRLFHVGDAAGYVEPFTGEGMAWAIEGGLSVAPIARAGLDRWTDDHCKKWNQVYRGRIRRSQWICRGFMQALHRPYLGRLTAAVFQRFPRAADRLIAAINRPVGRATD